MTDWKPRIDGNYSSWQPQFDQKLQEHCSDPNSFEYGVSVFGNGASRALFRTFFRQSGVDAMTRAVENQSIGSYVGGKGEFIAWLIIAFLLFVVSIVLSFSLMKCFRGNFQKCKGACRDRPRYHPRDLAGSKQTVFKLLSIFGLLGMFALSIVCFVYSANLSYGNNAVQCDFWQSMRGHFFGAQNIISPDGVAKDWKGSHVQWQAMVELKETVNPKPADPNTLCPMCEQIYNVFDGSGGLVETLSGSRDTVMIEAFKGGLLMETFSQGINQIHFPKEVKTTDGSFGAEWTSFLKQIKVQTGDVLATLLGTYATELNTTTNDGIALFEFNLNYYLGRNSMMLESSYETADTSVVSVGDVDYVMAQMVGIWDKKVGPLLNSSLTGVVVLASILGIFAFFFSIGGFALFWKLNKYIKDHTIPPVKVTKFLGGLYVILLVFSGFSFLMSSVLFFVGSAGSDGCGMANQALFDQGRWDIIPNNLLTDTITNKTDIPTVLDTCVKRTGDGDIAASLGIRMLLEKLRQAVETTETNLTTTVNVELDLEFKSLKTNALYQMAKDASSMIFSDRAAIKIKPAINPDGINDFIYTTVPNGLDIVATRPLKTRLAKLVIVDIAAGEPMLTVASNFLHNFIVGASGADLALDFLDDMAAKYTTASNPIGSFCSNHFGLIGLCDPKEKDGFLIQGNTSSSTVNDFINPFNDQRFIDFVHLFNKQEDLNNLQGVISATAQIINIDRLMATKLIDLTAPIVSKTVTNYTVQLPGIFDDAELGPDHVPVNADVIDMFQHILPNITCEGIKPTLQTDWEKCTMYDAITAWDTAGDDLANTLSYGFSFANAEILNFVHNVTIGSFQTLLDDADKNLQDFNCQFVGSSLDEGVTSGLCLALMPAVVSLGLAGIFLGLFSALGAYITWKAYHYYFDLINSGELPPKPVLKDIDEKADDDLSQELKENKETTFIDN